MSCDVALLKIVSENRTNSERFDRFEIGDDLAAPSSAYLAFISCETGVLIDEGVIEDAIVLRVAVQRANVIGGGQSQALVGLGHQVADVDLDRRRIHDGLGDAAEPAGWESGW